MKVAITWRGSDLPEAILRYQVPALRRAPQSRSEWLALFDDLVGDGSGGPGAWLAGRSGRSVRLAAALLGLWLLGSAFLWPHSAQQTWNALAVGALGAVAGRAALGCGRRGLYPTALLVLGVWLVGSSVLLRWRSPATPWNHLLVGSGLVALGLLTLVKLRRGGAWRREPASV